MSMSKKTALVVGGLFFLVLQFMSGVLRPIVYTPPKGMAFASPYRVASFTLRFTFIPQAELPCSGREWWCDYSHVIKKR